MQEKGFGKTFTIFSRIKVISSGKRRTSFVIAHQLSTIRDSDAILYMENGDIKEVGDHESLMALGGKYTVLDNRQFAKVDVSDKMHFDLF